ncbi:hypothetical protein [Sphingomonas sp. 35-24ZXX]|uniref:hypothetical protein n=1 Tax=Sphingomonas sp. 35-24ZXX TaxID=1545915 RepID=UPI00053BF411|nr:hypothetical protein [Sphingomonas sp. 35-24ZXX]
MTRLRILLHDDFICVQTSTQRMAHHRFKGASAIVIVSERHNRYGRTLAAVAVFSTARGFADDRGTFASL